MTPDPPELPGGEDRRQDVWTRARITEVLKASIEDRKHLNAHLKWVERAVGLIGAVVILVAVLLTGVPGTNWDGLVGANEDRAHQAQRLAERIQSERVRSIRRACEDQNGRHDRTVAALDAQLRIASLKASPRMRRQLAESRAFTVALLDALAPYQDCAALVQRSAPSAR